MLFVAGLLRVNDHSFYPRYDCQPALLTANRLRRLSPAAIQKRLRRRHPRRRGSIALVHDRREHFYRRSRMPARQRLDLRRRFGSSFHSKLPCHGRPASRHFMETNWVLAEMKKPRFREAAGEERLKAHQLTVKK